MKKLCVFILVFMAMGSFAQDTIVLLNGKKMLVNNVEVNDNKVLYRIGDKQKKMDSEGVFSIQYKSGEEKIVYQRDTLEPNDYSIEEMRMFIYGEQDAMINYHNNVNKIASAAVGFGSGILTIYGLVIPAAYATFVAGTTPDINKQKVTNTALKDNPSFREGYEAKSRNNKIKNSLIYGFAGFVAGFATFSLIFQN